MVQTVVYEIFDMAWAEGSALAVVTQNFVKCDPDAGKRERQVEDLAELPVPAHESQILVEHRDALTHMIERGLQDFAVVLDCRIGIVEQLERGFGGDHTLT